MEKKDSTLSKKPVSTYVLEKIFGSHIIQDLFTFVKAWTHFFVRKLSFFFFFLQIYLLVAYR